MALLHGNEKPADPSVSVPPEPIATAMSSLALLPPWRPLVIDAVPSVIDALPLTVRMPAKVSVPLAPLKVAEPLSVVVAPLEVELPVTSTTAVEEVVLKVPPVIVKPSVP